MEAEHVHDTSLLVCIRPHHLPVWQQTFIVHCEKSQRCLSLKQKNIHSFSCYVERTSNVSKRSKSDTFFYLTRVTQRYKRRAWNTFQWMHVHHPQKKYLKSNVRIKTIFKKKFIVRMKRFFYCMLESENFFIYLSLFIIV